MNYTELTNAIKEYTDNTETTFVNNIPNFVRQTEERIYRSILIPELRKNVTTSLSTSNRFLAKPTDFLAVFSIAVVDGSSNYSFLLPKDVNFITINQKANIILTAYDATVYGKIKGKVSKIGVNTLEDPATGETYYPITILAEDKSFDQRPNEVAEFVPGMEASVELVGEKRSIAQYIMKPFKKFQLEAFTDR